MATITQSKSMLKTYSCKAMFTSTNVFCAPTAKSLSLKGFVYLLMKAMLRTNAKQLMQLMSFSRGMRLYNFV